MSLRKKRAAWTWAPEAWAVYPGRTLQRALQFDIGTLLIGLEVDNGGLCYPGRLSRFVQAARCAHTAVFAVEGDPDMLHGSGRDNALRRAEAIARYQADAQPSARLNGIQYDIEPYTRAEFDVTSLGAREAWGAAAMMLSERLGAKLEHVLPFWMADSPAGTDLVRRLAPTSSSLTVMAYRTRPEEVVECATRLLALGGELGLPVRVALECGPAAHNERPPVYATATMRAFSSSQTGGQSADATLSLSDWCRPEWTRISFQGDVATMFVVADRVEQDLAPWPSFAGFAFHGLI